MAMAPAITLKRMYHCVPRSMSRIAAVFMPPPLRMRMSKRTGKEGGGRDAGGDLSQRLSDAREAWVEADATPAGTVQRVASSKATRTR